MKIVSHKTDGVRDVRSNGSHQTVVFQEHRNSIEFLRNAFRSISRDELAHWSVAATAKLSQMWCRASCSTAAE
jgi:hypothetical protein